jgi:hypothetical protein
MEINMKMSDSIANIAEALAKAQGAIDDASKANKNPFFNSKYADLASVRSVIREPLAVNDIAIVQLPRSLSGEVEVETMLIHKSGEFIAETLRLPVGKWDAHGIGSGITYARRYGLMSILGIAAEDDDGNASVAKVTATVVGGEGSGNPPSSKEAISIAKKGNKELQKYWNGLSEYDRNSFSAEERKNLKQIATDADVKKENS